MTQETTHPPLTDRDFMRKALDLAAVAQRHGDVPVGAVLTMDGKIVSAGFNQKEANHDPTAHAEMVALRQASAHRGGWRLSGATLYVTKEPCVMCAAACVAARVDRIVFACADPKGGGAGSVFNICSDSRLNHQIVVESGLMKGEAAELLRAFFRARRDEEL